MPATDDHTISLSPAERLRKHFSAWERRGRGWDVWNHPVELEPPFVPYFGFDGHINPQIDDGRKHTVLSSLLHWIHSIGRKRPPENAQAEVTEEPFPELWGRSEGLVELRLVVPTTTSITKDATEHFLLSIGRKPVAIEIIGLPEEIRFQMTCTASSAENITQQFQAYFPEAAIYPENETLEDKWNNAQRSKTAIADVGLAREFMLPLVSPSLDVDPLTGIVAALANLQSEEIAVLQVLFQPVGNPWAESILRAVSFPDGSPVFYGPRDLLKQAEVKVSRPLYAALVRIAVKAGNARVRPLFTSLTSALTPFASPEGNELMPLNNDGIDCDEHLNDLFERRSRRSGMILSSDELVGLVHPPAASLHNPKLRQQKATRAAPTLVLHQGLALGHNEHAGNTTMPRLSADQRTRHMHVLGGSGTGKSTFLLNMIIEDMKAGDGVALFDPHGDLVDSVLEHVPPNRINDVVLFDPADEEYPIGFNILSAHSDTEKNLLASDLVSVFRRLSTSWGDQMNAILANAILAFLESSRGGTLLDLRRFLVETVFRKDFLETVRDAEVIYYWTKQFPLVAGRSAGSILTRLDTFLRPKSIRRMVGQQANRLHLGEVMDTGKIFLARLSHGAIGEENAYLLGTFLVSKFHQLALSRQKQKESDRRFFWLYIDEVHNFATPSMAAILSGARKYRLGLVVAHQELHQIERAAPEVASALGNAYTRVCFRLGDKDAKQLENGFTGFTASDLQNLGTGEAICRVERPEYSFNLSTTKPMNIEPAVAEKLKEMVIAASRKQYATPLSDVETELARATPKSTSPTESERVKDEKRGDGDDATRLVTPSAFAAEPAYTAIPVSKPPKRSVPKAPEEVPSMGRGGTEHKYLQHLIKRFAEGLGFRADIEGEAMEGAADVALRKGRASIACEITITTEDAHELANVRKCLSAGFSHVIAVCPETKRIGKLQALIESQLSDTEKSKVRCLAPDDLLAFIRELAARELNEEKTVRGYKVKTSYRAVDDAEGADKRERISGVIAGALKRVASRKK